jgi:AcrR family transcriptional regulator
MGWIMAKSGGLTTRDRLKLAARRLFAERGVGAVTVRDILTEAGERNGASLNYYFTSKEDLVRELVVDIFTMMEMRWKHRLQALEARQNNPELRDYVRVLVDASDTSDVEEVPTTARLAEVFSQQYYPMVTSALKENKLQCYDLILSKIARLMAPIPSHIVRQRLVFVTRYLSSVFALYEATRTTGSVRQRATLGADYDLGDVVDTAVGLLTADVHDADAGIHNPLHAATASAGEIAQVLPFLTKGAAGHG